MYKPLYRNKFKLTALRRLGFTASAAVMLKPYSYLVWPIFGVRGFTAAKLKPTSYRKTLVSYRCNVTATFYSKAA